MDIENHNKEISQENIDALQHDKELRPDSRYSWLVCFSSFFCIFVSLGISNSFGVYQIHYIQNELSAVKPSTIAWIGTLSTAMMLITSVISGRVFTKLGFRNTVWIGCALGFTGLFVASFLKSVGGLIATQGILFGIGAGFVFPTTMAVTSQWFEKYRGLALGIIISGSGFGGLVISRILAAAIDNLGYKWALRITSFMYLAITLTGALVFKARINLTTTPKLVDFSAFKSPVFLSVTSCIFLANMGYVVPLFFIPSVIIELGGSASLASNQVTIFNVGYLIGGFVIGYLADVIGPLNVFGISTLVAGLLQLIFWVSFKSIASLSSVSFFYGFVAPGFVAQSISALARHHSPEKWAPYNGTFFTVGGISVILGNIIIERLLGTSASGPNYDSVAKFSGAIFAAGSLFVIPSILYLRTRAGSAKTWIM